MLYLLLINSTIRSLTLSNYFVKANTVTSEFLPVYLSLQLKYERTMSYSICDDSICIIHFFFNLYANLSLFKLIVYVCKYINVCYIMLENEGVDGWFKTVTWKKSTQQWHVKERFSATVTFPREHVLCGLMKRLVLKLFYICLFESLNFLVYRCLPDHIPLTDTKILPF